MKLRYIVNQAECFRRGINQPDSIVTIDVDPTSLSQEIRDLIADRLQGVDVLKLATITPSPIVRAHIVASVPGLAALIEACREDARALAAKSSPSQP